MIQDREIEELEYLCKRIKSRAEEMEYMLHGLRSEIQYLEECIAHITQDKKIFNSEDELTNILNNIKSPLECLDELATETIEPKTDEPTIAEQTTDELSIKIDSMLKSLDDF